METIKGLLRLGHNLPGEWIQKHRIDKPHGARSLYCLDHCIVLDAKPDTGRQKSIAFMPPSDPRGCLDVAFALCASLRSLNVALNEGNFKAAEAETRMWLPGCECIEQMHYSV